jgi:hypothetical protein
VVGSALFTAVAGSLSVASRSGRFFTHSEDALAFLIFSPVALLPFWIALLRVSDSHFANRILAIGSAFIGAVGAYMYYSSFVLDGRGESTFMVLIVPFCQFVMFMVVWSMAAAATRK